MAAAEMRARATIRSRDLVFATVAGGMSEGTEYAWVAMATRYRYFRKTAEEAQTKRMREGGRRVVVG